MAFAAEEEIRVGFELERLGVEAVERFVHAESPLESHG
jgi:hypothetical protein